MEIKKYNNFLNEVLALPPHREDTVTIPDIKNIPEIGENRMIFSIKTLYNMEHQDIVLTANRINSMINDGTYIKLKDRKHNLFHISQNEPMMLFGIRGGNQFTVGTHKQIECERDSIIIYSKPYDVLYIIDYNDFDIMELIFVRPKRVVAPYDPYGEEDWDENESVKTEEIEICRNIDEIFDEYLTYDRVVEYLKKELIGKEVEFYGRLTHNSFGKEIKKIIKDVVVGNYAIYFVCDDGTYEFPAHEEIKYKKSINRMITDEDPYGEEDWVG